MFVFFFSFFYFFFFFSDYVENDLLTYFVCCLFCLGSNNNKKRKSNKAKTPTSDDDNDNDSRTESEKSYADDSGSSESESESDNEINEAWTPPNKERKTGRQSRRNSKQSNKKKKPKNKTKSKNKHVTSKKKKQTVNNKSVGNLNKKINEYDANGDLITDTFADAYELDEDKQMEKYGFVVGTTLTPRTGSGSMRDYLNDNNKVKNSWNSMSQKWSVYSTTTTTTTSKSNTLVKPKKSSKKRSRQNFSNDTTVVSSGRVNRSHGKKNNSNSKTSNNNIFTTGVTTSLLKIKFFLNPNDYTDCHILVLPKYFNYRVCAKSNNNRFRSYCTSARSCKLNQNWFSIDKISTVLGGKLEFDVNVACPGNSHCPEQYPYESKYDFSSEGITHNVWPSQFGVNLELCYRTTTIESDRLVLCNLVKFLKQVGLRPLKFYIASTCCQLNEIHKNKAELNPTGIVNTANYYRNLHEFLLIQTCHREDFMQDYKEKGEFKKGERLSYCFFGKDYCIAQNGGLKIRDSKEDNKQNRFKMLQHFGYFKFSTIFICIFVFGCLLLWFWCILILVFDFVFDSGFLEF